MDLTPRDIQQKQFHDAFRGYAHEEVDLFLDEVAAAFDRVFRENQGFHHRLVQLEEELRKAQGSEDMLKRMLVTAQETADKAVQEAKTKASDFVSAAEARAQQIVTEAQAKADQIVAGAVSKERQLQVSIEALKRFDSEYRARLRAFMEGQLDAIAAGPELPPEPGPMRSEGSHDQQERTANGTHSAPSAPEQHASTVTGAPPVIEPKPGPEPEPVAAATRVAPAGPPPQVQQPQIRAQGRYVPDDSSATAPATPAVVTVPDTHHAEAKQGQDGPEEERSIKELFWGDD